jgi:hypothetical protein
MARFEKSWWEVLIIPIALAILGLIYLEILRENPVLIFPFIIFVITIGLLGWHLIVALEKLFSKEKDQKIKSIKLWISGLLSIIGIIFLFIFIIKPERNNLIRLGFFPQDEYIIYYMKQLQDTPTLTDSIEIISTTTLTPIIEETATEQPRWFSESCIPTSWNKFNVDGATNNECWVFQGQDLKGEEKGFSILNSGSQPSSFLIYRPTNEVNQITFRVRVKKLYSPDGKISTDFYFGFIQEDLNEMYPNTTNLSIKNVLDGEYIIIRGLEQTTTYGPIFQGNNPYNAHDIQVTDRDIKQNNVIDVDITINNNSWDVRIDNLSENNQLPFVRENLDILGKYFTFGFRIPENGVLEIDVYNLELQ